MPNAALKNGLNVQIVCNFHLFFFIFHVTMVGLFTPTHWHPKRWCLVKKSYLNLNELHLDFVRKMCENCVE